MLNLIICFIICNMCNVYIVYTINIFLCVTTFVCNYDTYAQLNKTKVGYSYSSQQGISRVPPNF